MVPEICEIAKIVSHHNVRRRIFPANHAQITHPKRAGTDLSSMFTVHLGDMWLEHLTLHAVWIDQFVSQRNAKATIVTDTMYKLIMNTTREVPLRLVFTEFHGKFVK